MPFPFFDTSKVKPLSEEDEEIQQLAAAYDKVNLLKKLTEKYRNHYRQQVLPTLRSSGNFPSFENWLRDNYPGQANDISASDEEKSEKKALYYAPLVDTEREDAYMNELVARCRAFLLDSKSSMLLYAQVVAFDDIYKTLTDTPPTVEDKNLPRKSPYAKLESFAEMIKLHRAVIEKHPQPSVFNMIFKTEGKKYILQVEKTLGPDVIALKEENQKEESQVDGIKQPLLSNKKKK